MGAVVVTGGTKGLGREIALEFARRGHFVAALYHADESAAREFEEALTTGGLHGCARKCDIRGEPGGWDEIWELREIRRAPSLILVNNACAPFQPTPLHLLRWADLEEQLAVTLKGSWHGAQSALRPMIRTGGGVIVNILTATVEGLPPKGFAAYNIAKHALRGLTLSLASELSGRGIRVFSVSPGLMRTALTEGWDERLQQAMRTAGVPLTAPAHAARRVADLSENAATEGLGEDHRV